MRFLVDTQPPQALAPWLSARGHQAEHVLDVGLAQSKDTQVWRCAQENGAVVVTKDADFTDRIMSSFPPPRVIHLRVGNLFLSNRGVCFAS